MHRSASDLVALFVELGQCGRRALHRGTSTTIERLVRSQTQANAKFVEAMPAFIESMKSWEVPNISVEDSFRVVDSAIGVVRDEWASEAFYWVNDWEEYGWQIDNCVGGSFSEFLLAIDEHLTGDQTPETLAHIFSFVRLSIIDVINADAGALLHAYTAQEVLLGYGRLASLADMLHRGKLPDDRYTDHERALYYSTTGTGEREREWLFFDMWKYTDSMRARFVRSEQFGRLMLLHPTTTPRVAQYLSRVQRVFVEGLVPETLIMCRALLESSINQACKSLLLPDKSAAIFELGKKINALGSTKRFSPKVISDARSIAMRGNHAVHDDPDQIKDSYETLELTLSVLNAIESEMLRANRKNSSLHT